ncbi:MAG: YebC/PmpR family DNA-binding transcriptional regulator [Bacteroidales bacterium]|jgi:YebC/PmpR family DNA-binding regulatory protein|nr:YebC/PmpR family DNA-binding transcriptional regulator [Bacteroidales bacterium]MBO7256556.1 YebC/PmpR family DNA-binding transcriptional regulator [Bacteroidales bacterium]MBO7283889.1 YebC/PmpR family DNA-binding transcriptional regulator [Bacteroidales bacterium]
MGRAFEFRKERKFKRWGNMARVFTRLGKEITIAAKAGGPDPDNNPRLRTLIQSARSENMPKENVERAIKRATEKDQGNYEEIVYEGYGPHGIAILVETATDNNMRTVANVRSYFTKVGGALGTQGSVSFMFDHKCVFKVKKEGEIDMEELELELIDFEVDDVYRDEEDDIIYIYGAFESFGNIQKYLEENSFTIVSGGFERIPNVPLKTLEAAEKETIMKLLDRLENDDDVQNVYHTMSLAE